MSSLVSKMSLKEILDEIELMLRENDIVYFCDDAEVILEFIRKYNKENRPKADEVREYLIAHEDVIDKEKLVLLIAKNYMDNIELMEERMREVRLQQRNHENEEELTSLLVQNRIQRAQLSDIIRMGKGMNTCITFYYYDENENRNIVSVLDSEEVIDRKPKNKSKNLRRLKAIDEFFNKEGSDKDVGLEYIMQSILLTDLCAIFPTEKFGSDIRIMVIENELMRRGIKSFEELQALRTPENAEKYNEVIDETDFKGILPYLKQTLMEYSAYVDVDALLLVSAYRFYTQLENNFIDPNSFKNTRDLLEGILKNVKPNSAISCRLQNKIDGSYDPMDVQYSAKQLKKCISQFTKTRYVTEPEIEEYRRKIAAKEMNLSELETGVAEVIFSDDELEALSKSSEENLIYVAEKCKWTSERLIEELKERKNISSDCLIALLQDYNLTNDQIIELYTCGTVSLDSIADLELILDFSGAVSFETLMEKYENATENPNNEDKQEEYKRYMELCKKVWMMDKTKEEQEENSSKLMEQIIENYDENEYIDVVKECYANGILTLDEIAEWDDKRLIASLYEGEQVTLSEIEELARNGKISPNYIEEIYKKQIQKPDIEYDERLAYIKTGFVSSKDILDLYNRNLLFEADLKDLAETGLITQAEFDKTVNGKTKAELEKHSSIILKGLNMLEKRNNDIYFGGQYGNWFTEGKTEKPKTIIDPNERADFIKLLNAYRAETDLEKDSPFYNYEFYVIPDETGEIGVNSVVIAERYYDDKDEEAKFATDNATYFFKYKDLMVLSNLKKSEMAKERENVVFTANHILSTENRAGYWASGVIYGLVKTMMSSDLKQYSKSRQRELVISKLEEMYSEDELSQILDKAIEIDRGEYNGEIVDSAKQEMER